MNDADYVIAWTFAISSMIAGVIMVLDWWHERDRRK